MTKILSMVNHKNYNLGANGGLNLWYFWLPSITSSIDGLTLKMKSQLVAYLLNGGEHIYWILDFKGEMHSTWDLWRSGFQECKGKYEIYSNCWCFFQHQRFDWNKYWQLDNAKSHCAFVKQTKQTIIAKYNKKLASTYTKFVRNLWPN